MIASQFRDVFVTPSYHDLSLGYPNTLGIQHGSTIEHSRYASALSILATVEAANGHDVWIAGSR